MLRFAISALFGISVFAISLVATPRIPAVAGTTQVARATAGAPSSFELAGMKPEVDVAQFDSESVLRAVFMTAVLGCVVLGRSSRSKVADDAARTRWVPSQPLATRLVSPTSNSLPPMPDASLVEAERHGDVVWINTQTGVVHERGSRWFGNTREGEYVLKRSADTGSYVSVRHVRARPELPELASA